MKKESKMVIAVLRPRGDGKTMDWENALRQALKDNQVEVIISYRYLYVPFFGFGGLLMRGTKTSKL